MKLLSLSSAVIAWLLAVVLVMQLLSGTFEVRTCQTACVQNIYWASLGLCILGLIVGWGFIKKPRPCSIVFANMALLLLLAIYLATMGIGTFT